MNQSLTSSSLSFDTPNVHRISDRQKNQDSTNYSLFLVIMGAKWGIFEPQDPHKIRDFWERASSTHHKIHYYPHILILYIAFAPIFYTRKTYLFYYTLSPPFTLISPPNLTPTPFQKQIKYESTGYPPHLSPFLSTSFSPIFPYLK